MAAPRAKPRAVLRHLDGRTVADAEPLGVLGGELDDLLGDGELQRRRDLDLGRGPDRAVGSEPQVTVVRARGA